MRLRGTDVKTMEEEGLDTDGAIESKSKLRGKIKALSGVDILTNTGAYKSTYEILKEISDVWEDIGDQDQAALLELLAGKRAGSVMSAILQNPDILKNAFEDANNAEGSALKENEKYLNSIQGRIDLFTNAVQTMWQNTLSSDTVKWFVDLGTQAIKLVDTLGLIPSILLAIGSYKGLGAVFGLFKDAGLSVTELLKRLWAYISGVQATTLAEKSLTQAQLTKKLTTQGLTEENAKAIVAETGLGVSTDKLTKETLEASMATLGYSEEQIKATTAKILGTAATEKSTAALLKEQVQSKLSNNQLIKSMATKYLAIKAEQDLTIAKYNLKLAEMGLLNGIATTAEVQAAQAAVEAASIPVDITKMTTTELLSAAFKGLALSVWSAVKAIATFLVTNPVGWAILAVGAIAGTVAIINATTKSAAELKEELDDLNSEISTMESDLDSLNSELKTTQERMSELLAMSSLSFTEEEELRNLQLQNAELERQIELQELLLKNKQTDRISKVKEVLDKTWYDKSSGKDDYAIDSDGVIIHDDFWHNGMSGKDALDKAIERYEKQKTWVENERIAQTEFRAKGKSWGDYRNYLKEQYGSNWRSQINNNLTSSWLTWDEVDGYLKGDEDKLTKMESGIAMVLSEMSDIIKENDLSYSSDDEEINKFLDEYYAYSIKFKNAQGAASKSSVISAIFDQTANESIKDLKDELNAIADSGYDTSTKIVNAHRKIDEALEDTTGQYQRLQTFMSTVGVSARELAEYFINASEAPDISTQEGVIQVYQDAIDIIGKYKEAESDVLGKDEEGKDITWSNLFTQDDSGKWVADKLKVASILEGSDEDIRTEFTKIAEAVRNGEMEVEDAITKLNFSGARKILDIEIKALSEKNIDIFPDLEEDIDGIIDKFSELSKAVGGTVDALDTLKKARAEEKNSGSVSIETLEKLMQYTDDYSKIVSVDETGAIHLATNAEDILIETRLEKIKQDANAALSEAELAYQEALHTQQTVTETGPAQEVLQGVINQVGGAIAFVTSLWSDLSSGNWAGSWDRAKQARESAIAKNESAYANMETEANANLAEAEANLKKAQDNAKIANSLNKNNLKTKYSSDDASDGADTEEDVIKNKWDEKLAKYERELALITNERDLIEAQISQLEATGSKASSQYYKDLIRNSSEEKQLLIEKKKELEEYLEANKDNVDQETWAEMNDEINATAVAIKECTTNLLEYYNTLEEIDSHYFEQAMDDVSRLSEEIQFVQGLLEDEKLVEDDGTFTEAGITTLGLYISEMERAAKAQEQYQKQIDNIAASWSAYQNLLKNAEDINGDGIITVEDIDTKELDELYKKYGVVITSEEEFKEKTDQATDSMHDQVEAQQAARKGLIQLAQARIDAIKDGINKEIEAYEDLIDLKKEELDAERNLFEFRKNVQKQTKDIASLERRIASLSGSDNAADIAERKRLEAQLYDQKESLNDTYYDHAKDQQSQALDDEAEAFRDAKERYMEQLDEWMEDTEAVVNHMILEGLFNADVISEFLGNVETQYGIPLSTDLKQPWIDASEQAKEWKKSVEAYTGECIPFVVSLSDKIKEKLGENGAWSDAEQAAKDYADFITSEDLKNNLNTRISAFCTSIGGIVSKWEDVKKKADEAYTAQYRAANVGGGTGGGDNTDNPNTDSNTDPNVDPEPKIKASYQDVKMLQSILREVFSQSISSTGQYDDKTKAAVKGMQQVLKDAGFYSLSIDGKYGSGTKDALSQYVNSNIRQTSSSSQREKWFNGKAVSFFRNRSSYIPSAFYAKGTTGTKKDQWAITDEPQFGDELTMYATPEGTLSYMRVGSTVTPATLTKEIMDIANVGLDGLMNANKFGANVNIISNAINKPELNLSFDSLVHVDNCSQDTLKDLEKMVDTKFNQWTRQLNYAIKRL